MTVFADMKARLEEYNSNEQRDNHSGNAADSETSIQAQAQGISNSSNVTSIGEAVYSAVIRCCCSNNDLPHALEVYNEVKANGVNVKLRTFISLLQLISTYVTPEPGADNGSCATEDNLNLCAPLSKELFDQCNQLFVDMTTAYQLQPTEREYVCMLRCCVRADQEGSFFDYLDNFMEDVLVPAKDSLEIVRGWFFPPAGVAEAVKSASRRGYRAVECRAEPTGPFTDSDRWLSSHDPSNYSKTPHRPHVEGRATAEGNVVNVSERSQTLEPESESAVATGASGATNGATNGAEEKPSRGQEEPHSADDGHVDASKKRKLAPPEGATESADDGEAGGAANKSKHPSKKAKGQRKHLDVATRVRIFGEYKHWLESCQQMGKSSGPVALSSGAVTSSGAAENGADAHSKARAKPGRGQFPSPFPFDVIVDGANVGYYKQNFAGAPAHVDYQQIDWVVRWLRLNGFTPLLILHCRYVIRDDTIKLGGVVTLILVGIAGICSRTPCLLKQLK
jgi:pentatricopeptide repeat protein